jgi:hypothetical protein
MKVADAALGQRAGQRRLRKPRPPRRRDGADVDQKVGADGLELTQELRERLSLIADREERPAQSNSSSRKLFRRLCGFWP